MNILPQTIGCNGYSALGYHEGWGNVFSKILRFIHRPWPGCPWSWIKVFFPITIISWSYNIKILIFKESWAPKNCCFWTVVLEKTLESLLDCKEIQPVHPKGDQSWVFTGRTDVEAETPILWPPDAKSWLIWKDRDAGKDWGQEEKGTTEDEMVGWNHRLSGHGFGWTLGVGDGQGGLACRSWNRKELDMTEWLDWTEYLIQKWVQFQTFHLKLILLINWIKLTGILFIFTNDNYLQFVLQELALLSFFNHNFI